MSSETTDFYKFISSIFLSLSFIAVLIVGRESVSFLRNTPPVGFRGNWINNCNLVVAGDSGSAFAVNPELLVLKNHYKGRNFSFNGNALSRKYLEMVSALLVTDNPRVIIFGLTPHMFAPHAFKDNAFMHYKPPSLGERIFSRIFGDKFNLFSTMTMSEIRYIISRGQYKQPIEIYSNSTGWMEAYHNIPDNEASELKSYARNFQFGPVKQDVIQYFLKMVREWSSQGIVVIAFRPPTTERMLKLENQVSGFDEDLFVKMFEQAGGYWINVPQYGVYRCYDGSHITADSALALSRYLASEICTRIPVLKESLCADSL